MANAIDALAECLHESLDDDARDAAGALSELTDPVLGHLWNNLADSAYDDL